MEAILRQAILKWGIRAQLDMAIEENAELQKAICKLHRAKSEVEQQDCIDNILDEVADVEIMCQQIRIMFDEKEKVDEIKERKIQRLKERLNQSKP